MGKDLVANQLFVCYGVFVAHKRKGDGREQATIDLSAEAENKIKVFADARGATKKAVLSRLCSWFAEQPPLVKTVAMGWVDEGMEAAYAAALRKLADDLDGGQMLSDIKQQASPDPPVSSSAGGKPVIPPEKLSAELQESASQETK